MAFEKVDIGVWKPQEDNEEIVGTFVRMEEDVGANKSRLYHLDVDEKPVAIWGSAVLDTKMTAAKAGDRIKVVYLGKGEAKAGQNPPKMFEVYIDYDARKSSEPIKEEIALPADPKA